MVEELISALICHYCMNILITGGFEANFSVGFARGLVANGIELCVVSCDDTAPRLNALGITNVNLRGSLNANRPFWSKLSNLIRYYLRLLYFLFRHRGGTIHFAGIFRREWILWEGLVLNGCFRLLAGRYLYTVHNVLPHNCERSRFFRWIYRQIYKFPHHLLVHTSRARQQLMAEFGVPKERIHITSLGLNEEMPVSNLSRAEARTRLGFSESDQIILFFGKIDEYKGLDVLLSAFDRLPLSNARLIVAGEFRNPLYRARIQSLLETISHRSKVHLFERFIPNDEVEVFFKAGDVLCLPYRNIYQSGLVFLAPRFGLPMVTTDVGSLREFVGDIFGLVCRTNDAAGLEETLTTFFSNREQFSSAAILEKAQKYRWENICRALLPLYAGQSSAPLNPARPVATAL